MTVYFGVKKTKKFYLDESNDQWIEFKVLTEGERVQYQDSVSGKVSINQATQMGEIETRMGSDRAALIKLAVCGYDILVGEIGERLAGYDKAKWEELYEGMDGNVAEKLYDEIKKFNGFDKKK
jgi:hypothetical protein